MVEFSGGVGRNLNLSVGMMELYLRFSVIPLTIASLSVMATDRQFSDYYGKIGYANFSGFKYMISVDAISACYSVVAVFLSFYNTQISGWFFYVSDQAIAYLMVTSGSAVAEVVYLVYNGDKDISWSEGCTSYSKFCTKAKVSLVLHFVALLCFVALALFSAFKVFSNFEPPSVSGKEVVEQVE